jgi:hypothetical protein
MGPDDKIRPKRISNTDKEINKLVNLEAALDKKLDRKTAEYFSKNGQKNFTTRDKLQQQSGTSLQRIKS